MQVELSAACSSLKFQSTAAACAVLSPTHQQNLMQVVEDRALHDGTLILRETAILHTTMHKKTEALLVPNRVVF